MNTLNQSLERTIATADGRYLSTQELYPLEQYVQTYTARLHAYQQLRDHSEKFVVYALRKLAQAYPDLIKQHGPRCKYDMSEVLRYIALSVLRDDEIFFKEQMMTWLDTILLAHRRTAQCVVGYRHLQEAIATTLPVQDANLIRPYLDCVIQSLQAHV
jgi:hypothetical protein